MSKRRSLLAAALLLSGSVLVVPMTPSAAASAALPNDFNGDGVGDLAVGVPSETAGADLAPSGAVQIFYGKKAGVAATPDQFLSRSTRGLEFLRPHDAGFGSATASADFNHDGYADLAASAPGYDIHSTTPWTVNVGAVVVIYGSPTGLSPTGGIKARLWTQDSPGVHGVAEDGEGWGWALETGDFDANGFGDLVVGGPQEALGDIHRAGMISVLRGSASGLTATGEQYWSQNTAGIQGASEANDDFGRTLTAGDFDGDGADDLAVGVVAEGISGSTLSGAVNVLYGAAGKALTARDRFVSQNSPGIPGVAEDDDRFGQRLDAGDFNGDGRDDLVMSTPMEDAGGYADIGVVTVMYGSAAGLDPTHVDWLHLGNIDGPPAVNRHRTYFGSGVAAGDADDDGFDDLAIDVGGEGRVDLVSGSATGLDRSNVWTMWSDTASGLPLGGKLSMADLDSTPGADLISAMPTASVPTADGTLAKWAGMVRLFSGGGSTGFSPDRSLMFHQGMPGVAGEPEESDSFGSSVPGVE